MRILQVVHGFYPMRKAGTEIYTYYLSRELAKEHEVHVFYPVLRKTAKRELRIREMKREGMHLHELVIPNGILDKIKRWDSMFFENTYRNFGIERIFEKLLKDINPDIIHFQHLIGLSAGLIEIAKRYGFPTVLTLHDYWFMCPTVNLLRWDYSLCDGPDPETCWLCWSEKRSESLAEVFSKFHIPKSLTLRPIKGILKTLNYPAKFEERQRYFKSLLLKVDKIIAPSQFLRNMFIKYGVQEDKIIYSENGYNLEVFREFRKKKKSTNKIVFGFAGTVIPIKGVHILIDAFLKVPKEKAELQIYGSYNQKSAYVKSLFKKIQGRSNIHFLGRYDDPKVPFSEIDILVFPSISYENCPLVLAEARTTKTPVIASNLGAIPEFMEEGKTGLLFEPNNSKDLYEKIIHIIENPELIEKFKANIKPPKSIEEQAKEIEGIYYTLILKRLEMV